MQRSVLLLAVLLAGCTTAALDGDGPQLACIRCGAMLPAGDNTWEPSAAIDPTDSDHYVIALKADDPSIEVYATFDAGQTWQGTTVPLDGVGASTQWTHTGDPVTFFAPDGTLHVGGLGIAYEPSGAVVASTRAGADIFVARSPDGGLSFDRPVAVATGSGTYYSTPDATVADHYQNQDRPWFAAGPDGRIVAAWKELGHDGVYPVIAQQRPVQYDGNIFQIAVSTDGGTTWSSPVSFDDPGYPGALVMADGTFVVAHSSHRTGTLSIGRSATGADWSWEEVGFLVGQPVLREQQGRLLVAGTSRHEDAWAPSYWREGDNGWQGPYIFGAAQKNDPFTNMAVHGQDIWFSWYSQDDGVDGAGRYHLGVADDPDSPWVPTRWVVDEGFDGRIPRYGHYVDTLGVGDRIYTAWGASHGSGQPVKVSVYGWV